jgi:hypothetical protein
LPDAILVGEERDVIPKKQQSTSGIVRAAASVGEGGASELHMLK